jgi:hypothetical protein
MWQGDGWPCFFAICVLVAIPSLICWPGCSGAGILTRLDR